VLSAQAGGCAVRRARVGEKRIYADFPAKTTTNSALMFLHTGTGNDVAGQAAASYARE
jgi:hypothetical protein